MYQLETRFARIITTKFGLVLVHGRWTNTVIDGRFKDLHDFEQKGGSSSAAGGYFLDVNKYPDYIKEGTWVMTCPLTTTKLMLICSGSVMPFAPRVSVIVRLSDYTCTLTSTSCGKDLDHVRANPSIPHVGKLSASNDMVPQALPPPQQNLRLLEKQLIALAHPIARVVRLNGGAQYGYRGHILNVARDVTTFATSLP